MCTALPLLLQRPCAAKGAPHTCASWLLVLPSLLTLCVLLLVVVGVRGALLAVALFSAVALLSGVLPLSALVLPAAVALFSAVALLSGVVPFSAVALLSAAVLHVGRGAVALLSAAAVLHVGRGEMQPTTAPSPHTGCMRGGSL